MDIKERPMSRSKLMGTVFGLALAIGLPGVAGAATFIQTSDHCTGNCGIDSGNIITVTTSGSLTTISATLASGWSFVDTGANGGGGSLNFGFTSSQPNVTLTNTSG